MPRTSSRPRGSCIGTFGVSTPVRDGVEVTCACERVSTSGLLLPRARASCTRSHSRVSGRALSYLGGRRVPSSPEPPSTLFLFPRVAQRCLIAAGKQPYSDEKMEPKVAQKNAAVETKTDRTRSPGQAASIRTSRMITTKMTDKKLTYSEASIY